MPTTLTAWKADTTSAAGQDKATEMPTHFLCELLFSVCICKDIYLSLKTTLATCAHLHKRIQLCNTSGVRYSLDR